MIIGNQKQTDVIIDGQSSTKTASINGDKLAKLQYILTQGLYKDGISAVMVEICNNGMDSIIQSGKNPIENPVIVKLFRDTRGNYQITIEDKGLGMDADFFENVFMSMLSSTKEQDNDVIGNFGIGGKSWSSLNRPVNFTIRKDGKEWKYLCYKGETFIEYDQISESDITEENGVIFQMQIRDYSEYAQFQKKAKQKLAYYDSVALFIEGRLWENQIYRNELFQWSKEKPYSEMHLCLKDVVYTIDYEKLGIQRINLPVALRFNLDSGLFPTPSREDILFNRESIQIIKDRIAQVSEWFITRYNETVKEFDDLRSAYKHIGSHNKYLSLEGSTFDVYELQDHSTVKCMEPILKGVHLRDSAYYKNKRIALLEEYEAIGVDERGMWKVKHVNTELSSIWYEWQSRKVVLYNDVLSGNIKEYLRYKYGGDTIYAKKIGNRSLKKQHYLGLESYRSLLLLTGTNKSQWRALIQEWQTVRDSIVSTFTDESDVENSDNYKKWLENKKEEQKLNRSKPNYKGTSLNKQSGDITIAYARLHAVDRSSAVFDKKALPIKDLYKNKFLTLYFEDTPENKAKASYLYPLTENFKLKIALIGKKELKNLPELHNFKTMDQFQKTAQFRKWATANKAREVISIYDSLSKSTESILKVVVERHYQDVETLRAYQRKNFSAIDDNLHKSIMAVAEENKLFDLEIMVIVNRVKKEIDLFDFVHALRVPSSWNDHEKKLYTRLFHQMLLFKKKQYGVFSEYEIVPVVPTHVLEEMYTDHLEVAGNGELVETI